MSGRVSRPAPSAHGARPDRNPVSQEAGNGSHEDTRTRGRQARGPSSRGSCPSATTACWHPARRHSPDCGSRASVLLTRRFGEPRKGQPEGWTRPLRSVPRANAELAAQRTRDLPRQHGPAPPVHPRHPVPLAVDPHPFPLQQARQASAPVHQVPHCSRTLTVPSSSTLSRSWLTGPVAEIFS